MTNVLYDHPGPRARKRNLILSVVFGGALLWVLWLIYQAFDRKGVWAAAQWKPFLEADSWTKHLLPGLLEMLQAAGTSIVFALIFGVVFAVLRLSKLRILRIPAGMVIEFFRAVPLLLMIFFLFYGGYAVFGISVPEFWAVVIGLTLYNGSVLAEAFRAGVQAVPKGQSEAANSLGLSSLQTMRLVLLPQATRSMLPVIISQVVVIVKDTALGYIIAFEELMFEGGTLFAKDNGPGVVPTYMVLAVIFILINATLTFVAGWIDKHTGVKRSRGKVTTAKLSSATVG